MLNRASLDKADGLLSRLAKSQEDLDRSRHRGGCVRGRGGDLQPRNSFRGRGGRRECAADRDAHHHHRKAMRKDCCYFFCWRLRLACGPIRNRSSRHRSDRRFVGRAEAGARRRGQLFAGSGEHFREFFPQRARSSCVWSRPIRRSSRRRGKRMHRRVRRSSVWMAITRSYFSRSRASFARWHDDTLEPLDWAVDGEVLSIRANRRSPYGKTARYRSFVPMVPWSIPSPTPRGRCCFYRRRRLRDQGRNCTSARRQRSSI